MLQVTDVTGRQVLQQSISINGDNQSQRINLASSASKGVYLIKIADAQSKIVFNTKIVVQ